MIKAVLQTRILGPLIEFDLNTRRLRRMSLLDLWKNSPEQLQGKQVQQLVAIAGDGKLTDDGTCSREFRDFLASVPSANLVAYCEQCLSTGFPDSGFVLQDIVNEVGARLGATATRGRYRGTVKQTGFDGLWLFPSNHSIIQECRDAPGCETGHPSRRFALACHDSLIMPLAALRPCRFATPSACSGNWLRSSFLHKWLDGVSDALAYALRRLGTYRPPSHTAIRPRLPATGDHAPSCSALSMARSGRGQDVGHVSHRSQHDCRLSPKPCRLECHKGSPIIHAVRCRTAGHRRP